VIEPCIPIDEIDRTREISALGLSRKQGEERFDAVLRIARRLFDVPIALVSIVEDDVQWFKANSGLLADDGTPVTELPRRTSFCGHTILANSINYIPDTLEDERFFDNPLVTGHPHIRFYVGYPIKVSAGMAIGSLCLIDTKPRQFDEQELQILSDLGAVIERELYISQLAEVDDLTLLLNRRGLTSLGNHLLTEAVAKQYGVSILSFDLDKFKPINDTYGHAEGDIALKLFADVLRRCLRSQDLIARTGGDEFVAVLPNLTAEEANTIVARFWEYLDLANQQSDKPYSLAASVGVSHFNRDEITSLEQMLNSTDSLMYSVKKKNQSIAQSGNFVG
jgi:diguanylate cyclase (GGDEF)-like protein